MISQEDARELALYAATVVEKHDGEEDLEWQDSSIAELRALLHRLGYEVPDKSAGADYENWASFWEEVR